MLLAYSLIFCLWNIPDSKHKSGQSLHKHTPTPRYRTRISHRRGKWVSQKCIRSVLTRNLWHPIIPLATEKLSLGRQIGGMVERAVEDVDEITGVGLDSSRNQIAEVSFSRFNGLRNVFMQ
jgi:hypothetical protein